MKILLIILGLSSGITVGAGVVAILTLVGVVPRMAQISNTKNYIGMYERILVVGSLLGALISIQNISLNIGKMPTIIAGISYGIFIGFLSSGLTEVLDYIPVVSRRMKIPVIYLKYIIIAMVIGKVIGSFVGWTIIKGG